MASVELADRLTTKINIYSNLDPDWVQYVKDHRSVLMASATTKTVPPNLMFTFRYRMTTLLDRLDSDRSIAWIVMWLNQLKSDADVVNLTELIVPSLESIKTLYQTYASYKQKLSKLV